MGTNAIITAIDKELAHLRQIRGLLVQKGSAASPAKKSSSRGAGRKNRLSPAARARISEAQRKRWAAARKRAKG